MGRSLRVGESGNLRIGHWYIKTRFIASLCTRINHGDTEGTELHGEKGEVSRKGPSAAQRSPRKSRDEGPCISLRSERTAWREGGASRLPSSEGPGVGSPIADKLWGDHRPGKTLGFRTFRRFPLAMDCSCHDPPITRGISANPPPAPPRRGAAMRRLPAMR